VRTTTRRNGAGRRPSRGCARPGDSGSLPSGGGAREQQQPASFHSRHVIAEAYTSPVESRKASIEHFMLGDIAVGKDEIRTTRDAFYSCEGAEEESVTIIVPCMIGWMRHRY
jgi:hypothetical protein